MWPTPLSLTGTKGKRQPGAAGEREGREGPGIWNTGSMKILVTAFDAFGGESINPTERALQQLPDRIGDAKPIKLVIPTKFGE